jgi:hypothetical protein
VFVLVGAPLADIGLIQRVKASNNHVSRSQLEVAPININGFHLASSNYKKSNYFLATDIFG